MKVLISQSMQHNLNLNNTDEYTFTDIPGPSIDIIVDFQDGASKSIGLCSNVKYVILTTAGYDQLDLAYIKEKAITLTNAKGIFSLPIAEHVVGQIISFNRRFRLYQHQADRLIWKRHDGLYELTGSTVGFLGGGSIAKAILKLLQGFDITSLVYKRSAHKDGFDELYRTPEELIRLFEKSDIIINTLPLTKETTRLVGEELLSVAKKDLFYVNVGRGQTTDEKALINVLREKSIRGAYLDVFEVEPLTEDYRDIDNLIVTPHNSQSSIHTNKRLEQLIKANLECISNQKPLYNEIS